MKNHAWSFIAGMMVLLIAECIVYTCILKPVNSEKSQWWLEKNTLAFMVAEGRIPFSAAELVDFVAADEREERIHALESCFEFIGGKSAGNEPHSVFIRRKDGNLVLENRLNRRLNECVEQLNRKEMGKKKEHD